MSSMNSEQNQANIVIKEKLNLNILTENTVKE